MGRVRESIKIKWTAVALALTLVGSGPPASAAPPRRRAAAPIRLVWHVEAPGGVAVDSKEPDRPINPASVVKLATTLWALERLGPEHRFETTFGYRGSLDRARGVLDGDLVVRGGADPDFHVENAFLVAQALNAAGLKQVTGRLLIDERFWIGWEGGSAHREPDPLRRVEIMAGRLRAALDPARWNESSRRSIERFVARRGLRGSPRPRVIVSGGASLAPAGLVMDKPLVVHRSNPLATILKRFNVHSNNDIERLGATLGPAGELEAFLTHPDSTVQLETLSGLGTNRMTPRTVVRLLGELRQSCERHGLRVEDVLPMVGCDAGTMRMLPRLEQQLSAAVVAKTGTLTSTDGGVSVLAGFARTAGGERLFCVAAPGSGRRIATARDAEQRWLLEWVGRAGGGDPKGCGAAEAFSDADVVVLPVPDGVAQEPPSQPLRLK